jgi:chemotaxis protein CheD
MNKPRLPFVVGTCNRFFNPTRGRWYVNLATGACYVTNVDDTLTTVLGSCIAACVRDPRRGIGGMNHFLLPTLEGSRSDFVTDSGRYGVHAMELMVNEIMKAGAERRELEFKIFGGGEVIDGMSDTGSQNVEFIRSYIEAEGFRVVAMDLGGEVARRIEYQPVSGNCRVKRLEGRRVLPNVAALEQTHKHSLVAKPAETDIELF